MSDFKLAEDFEQLADTVIANHEITTDSGKAILGFVGRIELDEKNENYGGITTSVVAVGDIVAMQEMIYAELAESLDNGEPPLIFQMLDSVLRAVKDDYNLTSEQLDSMVAENKGWEEIPENRVLH